MRPAPRGTCFHASKYLNQADGTYYIRTDMFPFSYFRNKDVKGRGYAPTCCVICTKFFGLCVLRVLGWFARVLSSCMSLFHDSGKQKFSHFLVFLIGKCTHVRYHVFLEVFCIVFCLLCEKLDWQALHEVQWWCCSNSEWLCCIWLSIN